MNTDKLQTLGVPLTDAYNTLQTFLGGLYVNDFNLFGRVWQVLVQAEPAVPKRSDATYNGFTCGIRTAKWCRCPHSRPSAVDRTRRDLSV